MMERWWTVITCRFGGRCDSPLATRDLIGQMNKRTRHIDAQTSDIKRQRTNIDQMLVRKTGPDFLDEALTNQKGHS